MEIAVTPRPHSQNRGDRSGNPLRSRVTRGVDSNEPKIRVVSTCFLSDDAQTFPPLETATFQNIPTTRTTHSLSIAVSPGTLDFTGLEGTLHFLSPFCLFLPSSFFRKNGTAELIQVSMKNFPLSFQSLLNKRKKMQNFFDNPRCSVMSRDRFFSALPRCFSFTGGRSVESWPWVGTNGRQLPDLGL